MGGDCDIELTSICSWSQDYASDHKIMQVSIHTHECIAQLKHSYELIALNFFPHCVCSKITIKPWQHAMWYERKWWRLHGSSFGGPLIFLCIKVAAEQLQHQCIKVATEQLQHQCPRGLPQCWGRKSILSSARWEIRWCHRRRWSKRVLQLLLPTPREKRGFFSTLA